MECPDDATLDDLIHGRLAPASLPALDAHLDGCPSCSALVAVLAGGSATSAPPAAAATSLERGARVGRYTVLEALGRGAMGVVYAAYDPRLDRRVALKLLRPDAAGSAAPREVMLREAQAMARLSHPNVVALFEAGEHDGCVFLAMELVAGRTLRAWLAERARGWRDVRDVLAQAGEGLAAAHAAGIVHRDFKPDNVIVGDDGRVRVTDFGLARSDGAQLAPDDLAAPERPDVESVAGALRGTPAYMSPEQLDRRPADAASDQFAFCVTLYEALNGVRPYTGASLAAVRAAMSAGALEPPRQRSGAPAWLERAVRRGLRVAPAERHASLRALLTALRRDGRSARGRAAILAAVVGIAGLAAAVGLRARPSAPAPCRGAAAEFAPVWNPARAERVTRGFMATGAAQAGEAARAVRALMDGLGARWTAAHEGTCRATWVTGEQSPALLDARMQCLRRRRDELDALLNQFERADPTVVRHAVDAVEDLGALDACGDRATLGALPPRPAEPARAAALAAVERDLGELRALIAAGRQEPARALDRKLVARAADTGYGPAVAEERLLGARLLRRSGALRDAVGAAREAVVAAEAAHDDRDAARGWLELLAAQGELGAWDDVAATALHGGAAITRMGDPPALRAALWYLRGVADYNAGRFDEAGAWLARARAQGAAGDGAPRGDQARVLTALGNLARARGRYDEALALHRAALALDLARLGAGHPDLARHEHNIAGVLRATGRLDEARAAYERALALEIAGAGPASPEAGLTHNSLGILALDAGDLAGAQRELDAALAALTASAHPDRALALQNLGVLAARQGRHAAALERFGAALAIERARFGDGHERVARVLKSTGQSLAALGRTREAAAALREAVRIARPQAARSAEAAHIADEADAALAALAPDAPAATVRRAPRTARAAHPVPVEAPIVDAPAAPPTAPRAPEPSPPLVAPAPSSAPVAPAPMSAPVAPAPPAPQPRPARPAARPYVPTGSTGYGPAQSWDPE